MLLTRKTQDKLDLEFDPRVVESTRPISGSAGLFKHSYHVIGANLVFANNNGPLKAFVHEFVRTHQDDELFYNDGKCIVDTGVYDRNRQLRTPLSCKLEDDTKTPLTLLDPWHGTNIGEALVTNPAADLPIVKLGDFSTTMPQNDTKGAVRSKTGLGNTAQSQAAAERVPVRKELVQQLQALLDASGSKGCQVTSYARPRGYTGTLNVICKNVQTRACLVSRGEEHVNNNAWLSVNPDGAVCYCCHASDCKQKGITYIGDVDTGLLDSDDDSPESSITSKSAAATMELDNDDAAGPSALLGNDDGRLHDSASVCPSKTMSTSGSATESRSSMNSAVIRELALTGPVETEEEARAVLSLASKAAGGQIHEHSGASLVSAKIQWLSRSFAPGSDSFMYAFESADVVQDDVAGCMVSLTQLRKIRWSMPDWIAFRESTVPLSNGYVKDMSLETFVKNVDPKTTTHVRSIILAARLLWPDEKERVYDLIKYSFKKSATCGLEHEEAFEAVWGAESNIDATTEFQECILEKLLIMEQPLLQDMLPRIMTPRIHGNSGRSSSKAGVRVARYKLSQDMLTFWLDTEDCEKMDTEYRLSFSTGDITSPNGNGIIYNMYGMKAFFAQDGNINLMASLLAEQGIKDKMRFDEDDGEWRIFNETYGVWKHPKTKYEPEDVVSTFVQQELLPLKELEFFFGKELAWERKRAACCQSSEGEAVEVSPDDSVSQSGLSVGSKRSGSTVGSLQKRWKSQLSLTLYRFAQTPREQAEVLKVLQLKVIFSFTKAQKKYTLCCPNGLVDLRSGELKGKPAADDFVTQMCYVEYDPNVDTACVLKMFEDYFPMEAYPDQKDMVAFLQQYLGYGLTLEMNLQLCVYGYGKGSNGKSIMTDMIEKVYGEELWSPLPVEALNKERGQNNDALNDARHARVAVVSETNGPPQINEAVFRTLVCGETIVNKAIYKKEVSFKTNFKLLFMSNHLPKFVGTADDVDATRRRLAYLKFRTIFVDTDRPQDMSIAAGLRQAGAPECLIKPKDPDYYNKHVAGKETAFLKFFVDGAKEYYANNMKITIPESMRQSLEAEEFDIPTALENFMDRLYPRSGSFQFVGDLYQEFTRSSIAEYGKDVAIKFESYNLKMFGTDLAAAIEKKKASSATSQFWGEIKKKTMRSNGKLAKAWNNLEIQSAEQLLPEHRFAPLRPMPP